MRYTTVAVALAVTMTGCADRKQVSAPVEFGFVAGVCMNTLEDPFFKDVAEGLAKEATAHQCQAEVVTCEGDPARQNEQIKAFVTRKVEGIIVVPCDPKAIAPAIRAANEAGINVFTAGTAAPVPGARVIGHFALDHRWGGKQVAADLIKVLGESGGKVAVLDSKPAECCRLRMQGFKEVVDAHNGKERAGKITIVAELPGTEGAESLLQTHADLAVVFALSDSAALWARAALERTGKADQVKVIGYGGQPEGLQALNEGRLYADVWEAPEKFSRALFDAFFAPGRIKATPEIVLQPSLFHQAEVRRPRARW
jgi:ribose transport system substrate-binding protein